MVVEPFLTWLLQDAAGPAFFGLPVTWAVTDLARSAKRWFRRLRGADELSRMVRASVGGDALSAAEFGSVRRLLEQEAIWVRVGRGEVEDLVQAIAGCLPDRPSADVLTTARAIAAGLLEFAIQDLEPAWFRRVLFARLERIAADHATALDQVVLIAHADLAVAVARQDAADAGRLALVTGQLGRVLDRLPPGRAGRAEVALYLAALASWLNADPWPQTRFGGPRLTPAAVERKLKIGPGTAASRDVVKDADELARECTRLVVIGGSGSGKTWLARRSARLCAEAALDALLDGAEPGEVELPLYTTCARLAAVPGGTGIRRAVVAAAFGHLPDLGGARVHDALQALFEERAGPTLFVLDSLDEAPDADDRVRQADTLRGPWRIMLTTRRASWQHQLAIEDGNPCQVEGTLQPLGYPDDVEGVISAWFAGRPAESAAISGQLRDRPGLQQAATVPLILAFYCIVGADGQLPARRSQLYSMVIRRMLTGRWRGSRAGEPDLGACLETLRDWARSAAQIDAVSGVGTWSDEVATPRAAGSDDDRAAIDHVALPQGPEDPDMVKTVRRFAHRSLQEHLVAEHIALRLPAREAAAELASHLWFDPDWEYAAAAAVAMHPNRDEVLGELIRLAAGSGCRRGGLAAIDGCWEIRRFLARVAQESAADDWSAQSAALIGEARLELANVRPSYLGGFPANEWPGSNDLALTVLLDRLDAHSAQADGHVYHTLPGVAAKLAVTAQQRNRTLHVLLQELQRQPRARYAGTLAEAITRLHPGPADRGLARNALIRRAEEEGDPVTARDAADSAVRLALTAVERMQLRRDLLGLLADLAHPDTDPSKVIALADVVLSLEVSPRDRAPLRRVLCQYLAIGTWRSAELIPPAIARLRPTTTERVQARRLLLSRIESERATGTGPMPGSVVPLAVTARERAETRRALLGLPAGLQSSELDAAVVRLAVTARERAETRQVFLSLMAAHPDRAMVLADELADLAVTPRERHEAQQALLGLIRVHPPHNAWTLGSIVARLAVTAQDRARTRRALLSLLIPGPIQATIALADIVAKLEPTPRERVLLRQVLLGEVQSLADVSLGLWKLAQIMLTLEPTARQRADLRRALLDRLATETVLGYARLLTQVLIQLEPGARERATAWPILADLLIQDLHRQWNVSDQLSSLIEIAIQLKPTARLAAAAREALLETVAAKPFDRWKLTQLLAHLHPTARERAVVRTTLLALLTAFPWLDGVPDMLVRFSVAEQERAESRDQLINLAASQDDGYPEFLDDAIMHLAATTTERAAAREAVFGYLRAEADPRQASELARTLIRLTAAPERAATRRALLKLLASPANPLVARELAAAATQLPLSARDRRLARSVLLGELARQQDPQAARELVHVLADLDPIAADLTGSRTWPIQLSSATKLLTAVRRNSTLPDWLTVLPLLSEPASTPSQ